ncbi:class I SAM-dependent methyltransferase [Streptomyces sp. ME02-6991-2A]|uniref:class I SAM-dependent methyltransferase n=1 Tax=Streptomyces sp. ME02-6991-2A TaxID=3028677 RepID=UPI0029A75CD5|nr:class I SAM-dependent methyltransferase [Streptomyces sp. ME02-6991-2A]MDX3379411.1 class I SAM-dependent methyltransferase [Streptomyces sp. ME02-6991-2A]
MTTASQESFLRTFHAERPAVTADAFGGARAADGRSSYEILCDRVTGSRRVLDLGCGDGLLLEVLARTEGRRLAGVDLSPEAVALARRRPGVSGATVVESRAQNLPFADDSFDACVSHMALMLMGDVEQVIAEVVRVLSPGATLACVIGGGAVGVEAYDLFLGLLRTAIKDAPATQRVPALGDRRTRSREGLDSLLGPAGFTPVDRETVAIDLSGPREQVWAALSGVYDVGPLDPGAVASLREEFFERVEGLAMPDGLVPCGMKVHVVTARLR